MTTHPDLPTAVAILEYEVYAATRLLEELELAGRIRGNGHHLRQRVSGLAVELLKERWIQEQPVTNNEAQP